MAAAERSNLHTSSAGGIATATNRKLMVGVLQILNDHWLIRQGVIPALPGPLARKFWDEKIRFDFLADHTGESVYVNAEYVQGLDEQGFYDAVVDLTAIIDARTAEGVLYGLSFGEERMFSEWEKLVKKEGIRGTDAKPVAHGLVKMFRVPAGFQQAATSLSDAKFHAFVDQLQSEFTRIVYRVISEERFGESEPPFVRRIKQRLAKPVTVNGTPQTLAHRGKVRAYGTYYSALDLNNNIKNGIKTLPLPKEQFSRSFGVLTPDFIEELETRGFIEEYLNTFCDNLTKSLQAKGLRQDSIDNTIKGIRYNPHLLIDHLLEAGQRAKVPIDESSFASPWRYNEFIDLVLRYKLRTGELGLEMIEDGELKRKMMAVVQQRLNRAFGVEGVNSIIPIECLMLFGVTQKDIHNIYGGNDLRGVVEYLDPLQHTLNALRRLRTDDLPGSRYALRMAVLLHDIGKVYGEDSTRIHEAKGAALADDALLGMAADDNRSAEPALIKFLVGTHSAFGVVYNSAGKYEEAKEPDISRKLTIPDDLKGRLSPQNLYLLAARVYEADTASIATICWQKLPEGLPREIKTRPERADPITKSRAIKAWIEKTGEIYEKFLVHQYLGIYDNDATFRELLRESGIDSRESARIFLSRLFASPDFPAFFIFRNNEGFALDDAFRVASAALRSVNWDATNFYDPLARCILDYFVIGDFGTREAPTLLISDQGPPMIKLIDALAGSSI